MTHNSFHLVPNSTMHVPSHLLIILNSSIRFRPRSSYPPSLFHTGNPCSLILLLLAGDVELNPGPSALTFTHLNIRSIRSFEKSSSLHNYLADHPTDILSLNETWLQPTDSDNFISSLAPSGFSARHRTSTSGHCDMYANASTRRLHERWPTQLLVPDSTTAIQYCMAPPSRTSTKSSLSSTRWLEWSQALQNAITLHRSWRNCTGSQSSRASPSKSLS